MKIPHKFSYYLEADTQIQLALSSNCVIVSHSVFLYKLSTLKFGKNQPWDRVMQTAE